MAMTATISLSPSTALINQTVNAVLTISNSGGAAVVVTSIAPYSFYTGSSVPYHPASNAGVANIGPSANISVPASGSQAFAIPFVFFAPSTGQYGAGNGTYSVSAICQSADGSVFSPTAATVTVNPIALPTTEQ